MKSSVDKCKEKFIEYSKLSGKGVKKAKTMKIEVENLAP
jgi:hypothetical protein